MAQNTEITIDASGYTQLTNANATEGTFQGLDKHTGFYLAFTADATPPSAGAAGHFYPPWTGWGTNKAFPSGMVRAWGRARFGTMNVRVEHD